MLISIVTTEVVLKNLRLMGLTLLITDIPGALSISLMIFDSHNSQTTQYIFVYQSGEKSKSVLKRAEHIFGS